jgi:Leucine-rich repeat (LRR) protein
LTELNVSNNKLKNISGVEKLKKLSILKLNFNNLTNIEQVQQISELEVLELSNNKLTKFPGISNLKYLTFLDIKNNQIKTIPNFSIENTIIYAHNNPFSNIYLFQNPTTAVLNVNWLAGKVKSIIEEVGNEKGAMLGIFGKWGLENHINWRFSNTTIENQENNTRL